MPLGTLSPEESARVKGLMQQEEVQQQAGPAPVQQEQPQQQPQVQGTDLVGAFNNSMKNMLVGFEESRIANIATTPGSQLLTQELREEQQRRADEVTQWRQTHAGGVDPWSMGGIAENIAGSLPYMALSTSGVGAGAIALSEAGSIYREQAPEEKDVLSAGLGGIGTAALGRVGASAMLRPLTTPTRGAGVRGLATDLGKAAGVEGVTEAGQELIQQAATGRDIDLAQAGEAGLYGAALGGITTGGARGVRAGTDIAGITTPAVTPDVAGDQPIPAQEGLTPEQEALRDLVDAGITPTHAEMNVAGESGPLRAGLSKAAQASRDISVTGSTVKAAERESRMEHLQQKSQEFETPFSTIVADADQRITELGRQKEATSGDEARLLQNQINELERIKKTANNIRKDSKDVLYGRTKEFGPLRDNIQSFQTELEGLGYQNLPDFASNFDRTRALTDMLQESVGSIQATGTGQARFGGDVVARRLVVPGTAGLMTGGTSEIAGAGREAFRKAVTAPLRKASIRRKFGRAPEAPTDVDVSQVGEGVAEVSQARLEQAQVSREAPVAEVDIAAQEQATLQKQKDDLYEKMVDAGIPQQEADSRLELINKPLTKREVTDIKQEVKAEKKARLAITTPRKTTKPSTSKNRADLSTKMTTANVDQDIQKKYLGEVQESTVKDGEAFNELLTSAKKDQAKVKKEEKARLEAERPSKRPKKKDKTKEDLAQDEKVKLEKALLGKKIPLKIRDKYLDKVEGSLNDIQRGRLVESAEAEVARAKASAEAKKAEAQKSSDLIKTDPSKAAEREAELTDTKDILKLDMRKKGIPKDISDAILSGVKDPLSTAKRGNLVQDAVDKSNERKTKANELVKAQEDKAKSAKGGVKRLEDDRVYLIKKELDIGTDPKDAKAKAADLDTPISAENKAVLDKQYSDKKKQYEKELKDAEIARKDTAVVNAIIDKYSKKGLDADTVHKVIGHIDGLSLKESAARDKFEKILDKLVEAKADVKKPGVSKSDINALIGKQIEGLKADVKSDLTSTLTTELNKKSPDIEKLEIAVNDLKEASIAPTASTLGLSKPQAKKLAGVRQALKIKRRIDEADVGSESSVFYREDFDSIRRAADNDKSPVAASARLALSGKKLGTDLPSRYDYKRKQKEEREEFKKSILEPGSIAGALSSRR